MNYTASVYLFYDPDHFIVFLMKNQDDATHKLIGETLPDIE